LINTAANRNQINADDFFEHVEENETQNTNIIPSNDPMEILIEMGFANRAKNQLLLTENRNDLNKVIELLTIDNNDDTDWFAHPH
jgi:hypothetical protein